MYGPEGDDASLPCRVKNLFQHYTVINLIEMERRCFLVVLFCQRESNLLLEIFLPDPGIQTP